MQTLILDELLGDDNPEATFHDSELKRFDVDLEHAVATLFFDIPVGSVVSETGGHDLVFRSGNLHFSRLLYFAVEPPRSSLDECPSESFWIADDGPLPDANVTSDVRVPDGLPEDAFCHYFFSNNTNSFVVVAALHASFVWTSGVPSAQRAFYYPGEEIPDGD